MEGALKPMDAEQLREHAHRTVNFIADYYKSIESFPVLSQVEPGYLHKCLPDSSSKHPERLESILDDLQQKIIPGVAHWQSPGYFAYYPSNSSVPGSLGEMLSAGFNVVGFSWITSPAATELEVIVLDWVAKMLKLPEQFFSSEAARCLNQAVELFSEIGRLTMAAIHCEELGKIHVTEQNFEKAIDFYERAADLYESDVHTISSNQCKRKVAELAAQLEQPCGKVEQRGLHSLIELEESTDQMPRVIIR